MAILNKYLTLLCWMDKLSTTETSSVLMLYTECVFFEYNKNLKTSSYTSIEYKVTVAYILVKGVFVFMSPFYLFNHFIIYMPRFCSLQNPCQPEYC